MTHRILTPRLEVIIKINLQKLRKPQSPMIQILLTMMKSAAVTLAATIAFDLTVAEMHLSFIN